MLVSMGVDREELVCAQEHFDKPIFSDALNWLGALVSSVSLVCAIEESIAPRLRPGDGGQEIRL